VQDQGQIIDSRTRWALAVILIVLVVAVIIAALTGGW
jgi:hypothetical protein